MLDIVQQAALITTSILLLSPLARILLTIFQALCSFVTVESFRREFMSILPGFICNLIVKMLQIST